MKKSSRTPRRLSKHDVILINDKLMNIYNLLTHDSVARISSIRQEHQKLGHDIGMIMAFLDGEIRGYSSTTAIPISTKSAKEITDTLLETVTFIEQLEMKLTPFVRQIPEYTRSLRKIATTFAMLSH